MLAPVDLAEVMRQVRNTPIHIVTLFLLCVGGSCSALIGYDWSAVRHTDDLEIATRIIAAQHDPEANIALTGDKSFLFSDIGKSFLMFRMQGRSWIALYEPYGGPDEARGR